MAEIREQAGTPERRATGRDANDIGRRLRQYRMLLESYASLAAAETLDGLFERLVEIIAVECGGELATIFLHDAQTDELYSRVLHGEVKAPSGEKATLNYDLVARRPAPAMPR